MADGITGRVLDSSRSAPSVRPHIVSSAEPPVEPADPSPALAVAVALAVAAAVVGRRAVRASAATTSVTLAGRKQKKVPTVLLAAGVVILAAWRPVVSAYRDHRYSSRWSRQPLGW